MRWFGRSWGAPVCVLRTRVATPVGESCPSCARVIVTGDDGFVVPFYAGREGPPTELYYHRACFLRTLGIER